jgi:hypothetical protein
MKAFVVLNKKRYLVASSDAYKEPKIKTFIQAYIRSLFCLDLTLFMSYMYTSPSTYYTQ